MTMERMAMAILLLLCVLLQACSLSDGRDECCLADTVLFRYTYRGSDRFKEYISTMRYFLFSGGGVLLGETEGKKSAPWSVDISALAPGDYRIVAVGNLRGCGSIASGTGTLRDFRLSLDRTEGDTEYLAGCDRLYWGECVFTVKDGEANYFTAEMSNIHCVLRVTVQWDMKPDYADGYAFQLDGVARGCSLSAEGSYAIGQHRFPTAGPYDAVMRQSEIIDGRELSASLITLRWTASDIPTLTLINSGRPITKKIDLGWVFRSWRWNPLRDDAQDYGIRLRIRSDNTIEIYQGSDMSVSDWIDGGYIG